MTTNRSLLYNSDFILCQDIKKSTKYHNSRHEPQFTTKKKNHCALFSQMILQKTKILLKRKKNTGKLHSNPTSWFNHNRAERLVENVSFSFYSASPALGVLEPNPSCHGAKALTTPDKQPVFWGY